MTSKPRPKRPPAPKEPICASCGRALVDHLGLQGTCAELQQYKAALSFAVLYVGIRLTPDAAKRVIDEIRRIRDGTKAEAKP